MENWTSGFLKKKNQTFIAADSAQYKVHAMLTGLVLELSPDLLSLDLFGYVEYVWVQSSFKNTSAEWLVRGMEKTW